MSRFNLIIVAALILFFSACKNQESAENMENPFFVEEYDTPFGVPPFNKIKPEHYVPAFVAGMKQHNEKIQSIIENNAAPSFENTIVAYGLSGKLLSDVSAVFYNIKSSDGTDTIQIIAKEMAPVLSKHYDEITLNQALFDRIKTVYELGEKLQLKGEDLKLLEETHKSFVRAGANLGEQDKETLKSINEALAVKTLTFSDNVLKETNAFKLIIENEDDLAGLPQSVIDAAAQTAQKNDLKGKWVFTLQKPSWIPFLTYSTKRELREKIYKAMYMRGNNGNEFDNNDLIKEIIQLRDNKAKLLGHENWAAYVLEERMAKNTDNVFNLLNQIWEPAIKMASAEADNIQKMIDAENGGFKLQSWDWWYYSEKIRKQKYDLDEEELRPYFVLDNVRDGAFYVANKLYGITFNEIKDVPVFNEEAKCFEVKEANGDHVGVLYVDYHPRETKRGGAWMNHYRKQSNFDKDVRPVIVNICNFSRPTADKPALLTSDEVITLFHEFGHGLHGLLSQCKYPGLSGTSVPRDFVELPSQVMEHWALHPEVIKVYAKHYQTGEIIPDELIDKIVASNEFNQGFKTTEYLAAAILDMHYHTLKDVEGLDVESFEQEIMNKYGLIDAIIPRYKSTYFMHVFSSPYGYSTGYYSYIWSEVLDADAFLAFKETGDIYNNEVASAFRTNILERGGSRDADEMYMNFRGKEPGIDPLLENRGLLN